MIDFDRYKEELLSKFPDELKEIINKNHSLPLLEKNIKKLCEKNEKCDLLVQAYTANVYITAREYKSNIGDRFKVFKYDDFLSECLKNKYLFNKDGHYIGEPENSIVTIEIEKDVKLDLCFGFYKNIKNNIVSTMFVLFHRKDITDENLFNILLEWRNLPSKDEKIKMYKNLLDKKIVFRRET